MGRVQKILWISFSFAVCVLASVFVVSIVFSRGSGQDLRHLPFLRGLNAGTENAGSSAIQAIEWQDKTHEFGVLPCGSTFEHAFTVWNPFDQVLTISGIEFGCSCTTTGIYKRVISPGDHTSIAVKLTAGRKSGKVSKAVTLKFSDDAIVPIRLILNGEIRAPVEVSPLSINISQLKRSGSDHSKFVAHSFGGAHVPNLRASASEPWLSVSLQDADSLHEKASQSWTGQVAIDWNQLPGGVHTAVVNLVEESSQKTVAQVVVVAETNNNVRSRPSRLFFGRVRKGEVGKRAIVITVDGESAICRDGILSIEHNLGDVLKIDKIESPISESMYMVTLRPVASTTTGLLRGSLTFNFAPECFSKLRIPVIAMVAE